AHGRRRGPDAAGGVGGVPQQTQGALGDHARGGAVTGILVAGDTGGESLAVGGFTQEQYIVETVFPLLLARSLAGLGRFVTGQRTVVGDGLGGGFAFVAGAGEDHLIVDEVLAVGVTEQEVGAVHVAGVDGRHDERRRPAAEGLVIFDLGGRWLLRALETRGQRERVHQQLTDFRVPRRGQGGLQAGGGAAGESALHSPYPSLDAGQRRAQFGPRLLLQEPDAEVERDGVEAAGENDAGAAVLRLLLLFIDHPAHPRHFAAQ